MRPSRPHVIQRSIVITLTLLVTSGAFGVAAPAAWAAGGDISTFAGDGSSGYSGDGGPATVAQLSSPYGVGSDAAGNIYMADQSNNVIRKVTTGGTISTVAGNGSAGFSGDGGAATAAALAGPADVAVDGSGNLFIADTGNAVVRKVDTTGKISTVVGTPGSPGFSGDGGQATLAQIDATYGVLPVGSTLYVADYNNHNVRKVAASGIITTFAGDGSASYSGDGGPATAAGVGYPIGMAIDSGGNLYVAESRDVTSAVRKITPSGIITTFAGTGFGGLSGDGGPATAAELNTPTDIVFDSSGRAYISDYLNNRIRRVDVSGLIHTVAGGPAGGYGGDGGPACFAQLNGPLGLALGSGGDVLIGDNSNNVVRRLAAPMPDCVAPVRNVVTDFDRDFKSDISVFRPSGGTWFVHQSGGGDTATGWGAAGDIAVPGDYDGDYQVDQAIYRPSTGLWAIHNSAGGDTAITFGGMAGDLPVAADFDGDGKTDIAIYRPSLGFWYIQRSGDLTMNANMFGFPGDIPVPADYDGDGRIDRAVFRPSTGTWFVHPSSSPDNDTSFSYGSSGDIPVVGDYDADGKADVAIFRPSTGLWAIHHSGGGPDTFVTYGGISGDVPVPADYDGDHRTEFAIFRPSSGAWYAHLSTMGLDAITTFGVPGDTPLPLPPAVRTTFFP